MAPGPEDSMRPGPSRRTALLCGALTALLGSIALEVGWAQEPDRDPPGEPAVAREREVGGEAAGGEASSGEAAGGEASGGEASGGEAAGGEAAADGDADGAPLDPTVPMTLWIGIYPLRVGDLDLRRGTANVTYYVWTRWAGSSSGTAYELSNGSVEAREHEYLYDEDGVFYAYYRCRAEVQLELDFHDFPFDEQWVSIEIEHAEEGDSAVVLRIDEDGVRHVEAPAVSGWLVEGPFYDVVDHRYRTSWGMPGADPEEVSNFPRARMRMRLGHAVGATFWKTFLTLFISVLIAFLAFFLHPNELEARVGLGVAGIFGSVTSHSVVASNLPEIPYMTLSDKVHLAGMTAVFLALLETALVGWLVQRQRSQTGVTIDRVARIVMPVGYAAIVAAFIVGR